MSVEKSLEWATQFWKKNQDLVEQIGQTGKDAVGQIKLLADKLEENRNEGQELADGLKTGDFQVAKDAGVKKQQQDLIDQIQEINKKIEKFKANPDIITGLDTTRGNLYLELADTFDDTIIGFVPFTPEEIADINNLIKQAALDTAARQRLADVLDAAVK